ncbi:hypothetical protein [Actinoplanes utahensis]|uniref:MalT-like TPR region domain-containing protein n=1 Tax=Actinoplanes utahensis TaxID=1869 RepID=A0A0A6UIF3_ACTUT|nr:hypothetical protein [Actinoplanes utahensis]KHD75860.1 hypothetical protein MB27_20760 [Actinoplanes utahensis]GIF32274.1 hypothetical protein Aut01nite_52600 [Actinoplanes utahensis]
MAAARDRAFWSVRTRMLIRDARETRGQELRTLIRELVHWAGYSADDPDVIDPELFAAFVEEFSRVSGNYGTVDDSIEQAIERVLDLQTSRGEPVTRLWIALARYRSMISLEDPRRLEALTTAVGSAPAGSEAWAEAILAMVWYSIDVSLYPQALRLCAELEERLPADLFAAKYRCGALTMSGIALFTSFQDLRKARNDLSEALTYEAAAAGDQQIRRWVATAYHYLGRVAEVERDYPAALSFYVRGQAIQETCPEELQALAFLQLRIAEPLIAVKAFDQARDHLQTTANLFRVSVEHSSGRLQGRLGFAFLQAAQGDVDGAFALVEEIREESRQMGFWRGELLCLGFRLSLLVRRRRLAPIPGTVLEILRTMRGGELGRNNALRLLTRIPLLVGVALRRMSHRRATGAPAPTAVRCPCPRHAT